MSERPPPPTPSPQPLRPGEAPRELHAQELEEVNRRLQHAYEELHALKSSLAEQVNKLRASEERFRLLVEGTKDYAIFLLDAEGRIASWNPGAERIKGYRAEEIIGQHFSRFYPAADVAAGKPPRELEIAVAQGKYEEEGWRVRKDGSQFWASVLITALWDEHGQLRGFSKITRDMTERKQAEEITLHLAEERAARQAAEVSARTIHEQREQLRVTLASIGDAVIATDNQGKVTLLNPVAEGLTGWSNADAVGLPLERVFDIKNELTGQAVENPVIRVLREGIIVGLANHTILLARDGTVRPIEDSGAPIRDEAGRTLGVVLVFRDLSAQRRAEGMLRQTQEQYRQIVETAQEGIWLIDAAGRTQFANARMAEMLGCTVEDLAQHTIWEFIHPESLEQVKAQQQRRAQGIAEQVEVRFRRCDGSDLWGLVSTGPVYGAEGRYRGALGLVSDITERRSGERASRFLADASASLAAVVDYESTLQKVAGLAVPFFADWCVVDLVQADGSLRRLAVAHKDPSKVHLANELHRRFPPDPKAPQGAGHIVRTGQPELVPEIGEAVLATMVPDPELRGILRELGLRSYLAVPIQARGVVQGVLSFVTAESGRTYGSADLAVAQDLGQRVAIALENARLYGELRESDRKKDESLAMLAHELRNPLAPIRNALQILRIPRVDAATAERVRDMMDRQMKHLVRLVDDLLDVSRIMRGKIELRKERVELASVVTRAVETAQPAIDAQKHHLTISLPSAPLTVNVDPVRLAQVLSNLLNNSAKYMESGGRIWLTAQPQGADLVLSVRDTGIGIAADFLPKVFDLFFQAERGVGRAQGGLGIGLTLVRRLVEMHGGSVTAASAGLGQGSEFVVRLPGILHAQADVPLPPELQPAPSVPVGPRRRILIVDDNVDAAESLAMLLRHMGQEVRVAYDGPAALEAADAFAPDLVFLDLGMPGMDGYEVARRLRRQYGRQKPVLIALTGWGQDEDRRRTRESGFDDHLIKPVEPQTLQQALLALEPASRQRR